MAYPEPVLALDDIQGNVLNGFNKHHQWLLGFRFGDDCGAVKQWLRKIGESITPVKISRASKIRAKQLSERERRTQMDDLFLSAAFSYDALTGLTGTSLPFSRAFMDGQWRRAPGVLGDDTRSLRNWVVGGSAETTPHIFLIVAADKRNRLVERKEDLTREADGHGLVCIYAEEGGVLPEANGGGYEHFGFLDNIARVRARGRASSAPDDYYTERKEVPQDPQLPEFTDIGQPLLWPGQFVLGYERQSAVDTRTPSPPADCYPSWIRNGSYLVFRRLRQNVGAFREFTQAGEHFAAEIVGRWRNGTPLQLSPDKPLDGKPSNDFVYQRSDWPLGSNTPGDPLGSRCPVSAHIRKVNPRDQGSDLGPSAETLRRAIIRRGIPYGKSLPEDARKGSEEWHADRGLLFLCYQASIEDAFETLMQDWMNSTAGPTAPQGFDMFVGQSPTASPRFCQLNGQIVSARKRFVEATAGGYFFTPSISAIRDVLCADK